MENPLHKSLARQVAMWSYGDVVVRCRLLSLEKELNFQISKTPQQREPFTLRRYQVKWYTDEPIVKEHRAVG
jgi:hypothetical protein